MMKKATRRVGMARLLKLASFLEKLPRKRFFFGKWVGSDWAGDQKLTCGTTACALGWGPSVPDLFKAGLRLRMGEFGFGFVSLSRRKKADLGAGYDTNESLHAAEHVFGITRHEAHFLFLPDFSPLSENATGRQVARQIRAFVKRGKCSRGWEASE